METIVDTSKLTFQDWLLNQVPREDPAGRLARKTLEIDTFVKIENSYPSWRRLFASHCDPEELDGLKDVWTEYLEARAEMARKQ